MKKFYMIIVLVFIGSISFYACSNDDETIIPEVEKAELSVFTPEATALKESTIASLLKLQDLKEKNLARSSDDLETQANNILKELTKQTIKMFNSYGLQDSWKEFDSLEDPRIALAGIMFLGILETNNEIETSPLLLSRSFESGSSQTCYDVYRVANCIVQALIGIDWNEVTAIVASYECVTKTIAKNIVKQLAKKLE